MRIECDNCQTRYAINDERLRGRVYRFRCRRCGHSMLLRGDVDRGLYFGGLLSTSQLVSLLVIAACSWKLYRLQKGRKPTAEAGSIDAAQARVSAPVFSPPAH